jgi:hypothetical protein
MASNAAELPYAAVAQGIFAALMGMEPGEVFPALGIRRKMEMLSGTYEIFRDLNRVEVVNRGGVFYLEQRVRSRTPRCP